MSKRIYLLVIHHGWSEAWHQLSQDKQDTLWSKVQEADEQAGMNAIAGCQARWSNEEVEGFFILEYPNMDAYLEKAAKLGELNWWRYFRGKTILGTRDPRWVE